MSRSYSTFREMEPFTDGWKKANYSAMVPSEHIQHSPLVMDAEGRQVPIIRYMFSGPSGETLVIKSEKIVGHSFALPPISTFSDAEYRYCSDQPGRDEEKFRDYDRYTHPDSSFYRPEKVDEFITKVVTEAGRAPTRSFVVPVSPPLNSGTNRIVQENTRKYGDENDLRRDDGKKLNGSPNWERHNEPYLTRGAANKPPMMGGVYDFYKRPQGYQGHNGRSHQLSKPTNDIGTAVDYLKQLSINPKEKDFKVASHPGPLGSTRPHPGSNISSPEELSDYYESEEDEEFDDRVNDKGRRKLFEKQGVYEKPKGNAPAVPLSQTHFPGSTMPKKEQPYANPEKIDSREASRRYGKSSARAVEEEQYEGTITSREAMKKYNGTFIPTGP